MLGGHGYFDSMKSNWKFLLSFAAIIGVLICLWLRTPIHH